MPSKHIRSTFPAVGGGGGSTTTVDAFSDAFTLRINTDEVANAAPSDAVSLGIQSDDANAAQSDTLSLGIQADDATAVPTDALTQLAITIADDTGVAVATDVDTYAMSFNAGDDPNAAQSETATLSFPSPDFADTTATQSETNSFNLRCWLSGSVQTAGTVTNPANANGSNDGLVASMTTAVAGTNPIMTSNCGSGLPTATVTSAVYRGWWNATISLVTSHCIIVGHSSSALFADVTFIDVTASVNHLAGDFTFDLIAGGINTLAKLQSLQIIHKSTDAVAGVTPATFTVDAGCIELTGAFT